MYTLKPTLEINMLLGVLVSPKFKEFANDALKYIEVETHITEISDALKEELCETKSRINDFRIGDMNEAHHINDLKILVERCENLIYLIEEADRFGV